MHFSERLSALDLSFLEIEDRESHMHVAAVLLFEARSLRRDDGGLDIDRIRASIEASLHEIPRYRQRVLPAPAGGRPVWADDRHFNLDYHVRHTCLPPPASERQLKRLVGRILSQQLDRGKPLWETWVVEGLAGDRFALVMKTHHCLVDGISGVTLLSKLLSPHAQKEPAEAPRWFPRPEPGTLRLLLDEAVHRVGMPLALAGRAARLVTRPRRALADAWSDVRSVAETVASGMVRASPTPLNPEHIGPHRRFDWVRMDLDAAKEVKNRLGGTLNDVVLATAAGAIGTYLEERRILAKSLAFRAMIPVSVRRSQDSDAPGNRVSMLIAPLPIGETDPRRRLERIVETTRRLKRSSRVRGGEAVETLADLLGTALITRSVRLAARIGAYNLVVTNVPGPPLPLYLFDARLLEMYPVVPLFSNQALGIALFSYDGGLYWGLNSDWDRVRDLHDLTELVAREFDDLYRAATTAATH